MLKKLIFSRKGRKNQQVDDLRRKLAHFRRAVSVFLRKDNVLRQKAGLLRYIYAEFRRSLIDLRQ